MTRIGFIDFLCRLLRLPRYSMLMDFTPIKFMKRLSNREKDVYAWILKPKVDDVKYGLKFGRMLAEHHYELKSTHIFLPGNIEGIKKLEPDYVRSLLKFYYSDNAREGGRK